MNECSNVEKYKEDSSMDGNNDTIIHKIVIGFTAPEPSNVLETLITNMDLLTLLNIPKLLDKVVHHTRCPISLSTMTDPYIKDDGYCYEKFRFLQH